MKKIFPLFALSFLLLASLISDPLFAQQGPRILIKEASFDFGEVEQGKIIAHSFVVLNKGDQPLQIKRVRPG